MIHEGDKLQQMCQWVGWWKTQSEHTCNSHLLSNMQCHCSSSLLFVSRFVWYLNHPSLYTNIYVCVEIVEDMVRMHTACHTAYVPVKQLAWLAYGTKQPRPFCLPYIVGLENSYYVFCLEDKEWGSQPKSFHWKVPFTLAPLYNWYSSKPADLYGGEREINRETH